MRILKVIGSNVMVTDHPCCEGILVLDSLRSRIELCIFCDDSVAMFCVFAEKTCYYELQFSLLVCTRDKQQVKVVGANTAS